MASAAIKQMTIWEQKYHDIVELFAFNDQLAATVESAANPQEQLALVEPLIETIGESADILTQEYIALCEGYDHARHTAKPRVEGALRRIYVSLSSTAKRARDARNAALAIMKKIKLHLESVVSHFVEMLPLSLDRVMQKQDMDELIARHANLSLILRGIGHAG